MSAKFTPGPWKYEDSTKTIRAAKENYWLATMDSWDGAVNHEANARLIAAAPDMLEALEELCADKYLSDPINADRMAKAKTAIAKAHGVQS